jgi:hypothetical protein
MLNGMLIFFEHSKNIVMLQTLLRLGMLCIQAYHLCKKFKYKSKYCLNVSKTNNFPV